MNGEARQIAADLIDEEFSEFEQFPREYAESAGWSPHNLKTGELDYTDHELRVLTAMVQEFLDEGMGYEEIIGQQGIRNYLSDLVASKAVKNLPPRIRRARNVRLAAANPARYYDAKDVAKNFLDRMPRDKWGVKVGAMTKTHEGKVLMQQMDDYASNLAQTAAELSFYLSMRGVSGSGDHGHEKAMEYAQRRLRAVRKAIGYSYP